MSHRLPRGAIRAVLLVLALSLVAAFAGASSGHAAQSVSIRPVCGAVPLGHVRCFSLVKGDASPFASGPSGYGPADLQSAYALPSATAGAGQTVAIVDAFDDPTAEQDLAQYRSFYGLPPCTTANGCFRKVNQNGGTLPMPPPSADWSLEISLDLDMVSATCPNCKILLVESNTNLDSDLYTAEDTAARLGANTVSNSWGGSEYSGQTADDAHFNHPGVAITASSGDSGYGVSYPAASRYLTAVGGTSLTRGGGTRGWTESAWSGAGSGCSAYDAKPAWQTDTGCSRRTVADVSAVADPNTGVAVLFGGLWWTVGGTSASSPIIASVYALAGNASTVNAGSYPYSHTAGLFDVTSGSNGTCSPTYLCHGAAGYDGPTGLGTPNGVSGF
ncbi:MAG TPA: S53 family peptidase [Gaiellaceae bacterium]